MFAICFFFFFLFIIDVACFIAPMYEYFITQQSTQIIFKNNNMYYIAYYFHPLFKEKYKKKYVNKM